MANTYQDPYRVLGIERTATAAEIKQAYFALVRAHPPERDPEMFKQIRTAYEALRDPAQRAETDMRLLQRWQPTDRRRPAPELHLRVEPHDLFVALRALTDLGRTDWAEHYSPVKLS
jgi:curved DNA-binding protein CbpA